MCYCVYSYVFFPCLFRHILANLIKYCRIINISHKIFLYVVGRHTESEIKSIVSQGMIRVTFIDAFSSHKSAAKVQESDIFIHKRKI